MIKDFFGSILGNIKERTQSPLLGSYTVAFIAYNWKPLVVLFTSKCTGASLVREVSSEFSSPIWDVGVPLIVAVAFSVLYPLAKSFIGRLNSFAQKREIEIEAELEEKRENLREKHKNKIESIIKSLEEMVVEDKLGYHDRKRIMDILPDEAELMAKHK